MSNALRISRLLLVLLAACAASPPAKAPIPEALVPAGQVARERLAAQGVQIYECRASQDAAAKAQWTFVAPEAALFDGAGRRVGKHFAGPRWEADDGSRIVGTVKARADAPQAGAIPWLLLTANAEGSAGRFSKMTSVQRINTVGGVAPQAPCDAATLGSSVRVPYTADYILLSP
ncbi:MAG: DUF3455 domain-containing protein [Rhizobacter sp.]